MIMGMKFSKKDPPPFGVKSHRARPYLGSNPLKGPANQITVQSSTSTTHHSKYIHLLEDGRAATKVQHYITEKEKRLFASANALAVYKTFKSILPKRGNYDGRRELDCAQSQTEGIVIYPQKG
jgi:hypothetical protein